METKYLVMIIAAVSTIVSAIISYLVAVRRIKIEKTKIYIEEQKNIKMLEIEQKKLSKISNDIHKEMQILKQQQLGEILKKRIEVYPILWEIVSVHWQYTDNNKKNLSWCKKFKIELQRFNEKYGVFLSQPVYEKIHDLRTQLELICITFSNDDSLIIDNLQIEIINSIWFGSKDYGHGLATHLKNDLGSYSQTAIRES